LMKWRQPAKSCTGSRVRIKQCRCRDESLDYLRDIVSGNFANCVGGQAVSIVRIGLGETKNFAEGYDAIFGKKKRNAAKQTKSAAKSKKRARAKKK
jgi:hypothetical protein